MRESIQKLKHSILFLAASLPILVVHSRGLPASASFSGCFPGDESRRSEKQAAQLELRFEEPFQPLRDAPVGLELVFGEQRAMRVDGRRLMRPTGQHPA